MTEGMVLKSIIFLFMCTFLYFYKSCLYIFSVRKNETIIPFDLVNNNYPLNSISHLHCLQQLMSSLSRDSWRHIILLQFMTCDYEISNSWECFGMDLHVVFKVKGVFHCAENRD